MTYKFKCEKCNKVVSVDMSIKEYTPDGHVCEECGSKLIRDYVDIAGAAIWKTSGAFGKSTS